MSLTVTGGGLFMPTALGIDTQNNIWVANQNGPLSAFNAQGTPLSATGYGVNSGSSIIHEVYGLAIDTSNNIWVTNANGGGGAGSVTQFYGVNNPLSLGTYNSFTDGSLQYPYAIAADTNGNLFIANSGTSSATVYNGSGNLVAASLGAMYNLADLPNAIVVDANHGFWLSGNDNVSHVSSSGALLTNAACCGQSYGMATDAAGDLWIADYLGGGGHHGAVAEAVTDSSNNTSVPLRDLTAGGIVHPIMVAVDAAQNVWISNFGAASITELAGSTSATPRRRHLSLHRRLRHRRLRPRRPPQRPLHPPPRPLRQPLGLQRVRLRRHHVLRPRRPHPHPPPPRPHRPLIQPLESLPSAAPFVTSHGTLWSREVSF